MVTVSGSRRGQHLQVADQRLDELPVRGLKDEQLDAVDLPVEPLRSSGGSAPVVGHVDRNDVIGHASGPT